MIDKLNSVQNIQQVQFKPAFRAAEEPTVTVPEENNINFKGAEALANYNKASVLNFDKSILEVEPILPTVVQPDAIGTIEGEKIYGSNGKLHSIVNRTGNTTVVYKTSPDNESMIESITTTDKKTGNVIRHQFNEIDNGKYVFTGVSEFDALTGDETRFTSFRDDNPIYAKKTSTKNNGIVQGVAYDFDNGHYIVTEELPDGKAYKRYEFNKNKELIEIYTNSHNSGVAKNNTVNFYNGAVISSNQEKTETLPNNMGREILSDPDIAPAELKEYPENIEGEKTFYSNGSLEYVTSGEIVYNYSPEGDLVSVKDGNKTVELDNRNGQTIIEDLGEGMKRTTQYSKNGNINVHFENGDLSKAISIDSNNNPRYYYEDQGDRTIKRFDFNDQGMLVSAWGDDI